MYEVFNRNIMKRVILTIGLFLIIQYSLCQNQLGMKVGCNYFNILKDNTSYDHSSSFSYNHNSI